MNDAERRELDRLRAAVLDLQRGMKNIPSRFGPVPRSVTYLRVEDGNELIAAASLNGLKSVSAGITAVPSASPVIGTTYADGLSSATDLDTGAIVWIASMVTLDGVDSQDLTGDLPEGIPVLCVRSLAVPITGGGGATATVWLPWRV